MLKEEICCYWNCLVAIIHALMRYITLKLSICLSTSNLFVALSCDVSVITDCKTYIQKILQMKQRWSVHLRIVKNGQCLWQRRTDPNYPSWPWGLQPPMSPRKIAFETSPALMIGCLWIFREKRIIKCLMWPWLLWGRGNYGKGELLGHRVGVYHYMWCWGSYR